MFFEGDLQSGIASALRDSKLVACFVQGHDEQSSLWEQVYFKDDQTSLALHNRAVTLRINADSQEASYLSAYYPIPVVPALIVIRDGHLVLDLRAGETKDSFKAAILRTLVNTSSFAPQATSDQNTFQLSTSTQGSSEASTAPDAHTAPSQTAPSRPTSSAAESATDPSSLPATITSSPQSSQVVENLLADRRRRLEVERKEKESAEKAQRKMKADARQAAITADPNPVKAKQATFAQQQRKRQQEAKLERERILRQIELDKIDRKEREEQRKALASAETNENDGVGGLANQQLSGDLNRVSRPAIANECAIQIRMFDGSTIRNRFPAKSFLRTDVRLWVDKERSDGDQPYTFKQILAPLPNRTLSISEEEESLQSLNLLPSATLIMVPVQGYTTAYVGNEGLVSRGAAAGYNIVSAGASLVSGTLGTLLGIGQATVPAERLTADERRQQAVAHADASSVSSGISIRTLHDQRDSQESHQLYNGNQLNFEPRRDTDDKED